MSHFHHIILRSTVLLGAISAGFGQATFSPLDGLTPPSLAPGTPAGSYALSDFETVDLFSGALNFHLPLAKVGGSRGESPYTMMLPIQQIWHVEQGLTCEGGSCDVQFYYPVPTSWNPTPDLYGPGRLDYRYDNPSDITACQGNLPIGATQSLTRLTFTAAGGTEYELRDDASNGMPNLNPVGDICTGQSPRPASRGTTFSTHDGSALRFVSDFPVSDTWVAYALTDAGNPPTGNLVFPNGTLYRVVCGQVVYIRDRNGNLTTFQYDNVWTYNSATGACSAGAGGLQTNRRLHRPTTCNHLW